MVGGGISQDLPLQKGGSGKGFNHYDGGGGKFHPIKGGSQNVLPCLEGRCKCCTPDLTQL